MCAANSLASPLNIDFAASDALLTTSDYVKFPDLQMYPTMAAAVVPIFNLGDVTNLTLSTSLLAQIFRGQVVVWDDAAILALNPQLNGTVPYRQPITLVVRSDASGTTQIFKKALAAFDSDFQSQIGTASSNMWANVTTTKRSGNQGVVSYVMSTPYTLGYSELGIALTNKLPMAKLQKHSGSVASASITSTDYALLELGLSFGNNGDDPSHLTADLENAQGANAWPIVGYTYLVMRRSTQRAGASCAYVQATISFWHWFWTSDIAARIVQTEHFSTLPSVVLEAVLGRFVADITCGGQAMYKSEALVPVRGQGTGLFSNLFTSLANVYRLVDPGVNLTYTAMDGAGLVSDSDLASTTFAATTDSTLAAPTNGYKLVFAGAGLAVISLMNVTLDGATLAGILQGDITTWLDPALTATNPSGIRDATGTVVTNASLPIQLLRGPMADSASLYSLMAQFRSQYTGAALKAAPMYASEDILRYHVLGSPLALAVTPYTGSFPSGLALAPYRHSGGAVVAPSWQAIGACAGDATFDAARTFRLSASASPTCYPLALALHLHVRKSQCDPVNDAARTAAVGFVEWMFRNAALPNALRAAGLAPLIDANAAAALANEAVLDAISCSPRSTNSSSGIPSGVIVAMCAAGGVVLLIVAGVVWHSTRRMRALRKQFSNDNVAQECAAAIARLDLDSVAWLSDLKNPNKIQKSFIQIVHILTEVKPFIPDQMLQLLMGQEEKQSEQMEDLASHRQEPPEKCLSPRQSVDSSAQQSRHSSVQGASAMDSAVSARQVSDSEVSVGRRNPTHTPMTESPKAKWRFEQVVAMVPEAERKWTRKRCAWLYARLGSRGSLDDPSNLAELSSLVASLIAVAKKHGATIERVGVETLVVHWGLSGHASQAAEKATLAGMDMVGLVKCKAGGLRSALSLRISVSYGWCHTTTLSASGHRFFVSAGTEMGLGTRLVHDGVYEKCQCHLLVSPGVHAEVQYNIKCLPRAWFGTTLLWQPLEHITHHDEEWMYELEKLEEGQSASKYRALVDVFGLVVEPRTSPNAILFALEAIKNRFANNLTPEDIASLDHLLATLPSPTASLDRVLSVRNGPVTCVDV
eukprot:EG_transcript_869